LLSVARDFSDVMYWWDVADVNEVFSLLKIKKYGTDYQKSVPYFYTCFFIP